MKNEKIYFLVIILFICSMPEAFAIMANSSNYSIGMFGSGLQSSNLTSTNYHGTMLLTYVTGTRNGNNTNYTANIGFFENTPYYETISITSYAIYPNSAVQGSIIRLSISALNSESVWAVLTLPSGSEEVITLTNNGDKYYTANYVGVYTVTFYANNSQGHIASAIDTFEITSSTITIPPSGGGGGTTIIIEKCTYIWDCTSWNICSEGKQQRTCKNIGNCTGTEGKPIETRECSDALFDIILKFKEIELTQNETLKFGIDLTETKGVEKIDVQIKYSIIDSNYTEIFSQIETRAIEGNLTFEKEINEVKLKEGEYILRVDILYGNLQRAFAEQKFQVKGGQIEKISDQGRSKTNQMVIIGLIILALLVLIISYLKKGSNKKFRKKPSRKHLIAALALGAIAVMFLEISSRINMTGFAISETTSTSNWSLIGIIFGLIVLLLIFRKKIFSAFNIKKDKESKTILNLQGKNVYTDSGDYVGKIEEVLLEKNKIDSLKIKLKDKKSKKKGLIILYKDVKAISRVVIIKGFDVDNLG